MGVIYKLRPEVKDFILEAKKNKPEMSCRDLATLVQNKFKIPISKSSINAIIKETGLSMPVGRRPKKRRQKPAFAAPAVIEPQVKSVAVLPSEKMPPKEPSQPAPVVPVEEVKTPAPEPAEKPIEKPPEKITPAPEEMPPAAPSAPSVQQPEIKEVITAKPAPFTLPVGVEVEGLGAMMLKAADYLLGGAVAISEVIKSRMRTTDSDLVAKTEALLFGALFGRREKTPLSPESGLWPLINQRFSPDELDAYFNELQQLKVLNSDLPRVIVDLFQEVRGIQVTLEDKTIFYLDSQLHTVWSTPHIPYDFSISLYNIKSYINKSFQKDEPLVLFTAPGYDTPTKEFFGFILSLEGKERGIKQLGLYGHKFEELETISLNLTKKHSFIFGLWPWQFGQFRSVKIAGEFKPFNFAGLKKDFYAAEAKIELLQPTINQSVTLRAVVLKTHPAEKIRLILVSNLSPEDIATAELCSLYLNRWPNLEEGFEDYSRKIELFTYTANSQQFFSLDKFSLTQESPLEITGLLDYYLQALDLYLRWHVFPSGYENNPFSTGKERFYGLKAVLEEQKGLLRAVFKPAPGYPFLKDLAYICRRLNEKNIEFSAAKRLWFSL